MNMKRKYIKIENIEKEINVKIQDKDKHIKVSSPGLYRIDVIGEDYECHKLEEAF